MRDAMTSYNTLWSQYFCMSASTSYLLPEGRPPPLPPFFSSDSSPSVVIESCRGLTLGMSPSSPKITPSPTIDDIASDATAALLMVMMRRHCKPMETKNFTPDMVATDDREPLHRGLFAVTCCVIVRDWRLTILIGLRLRFEIFHLPLFYALHVISFYVIAARKDFLMYDYIGKSSIMAGYYL